MTSRAPAPVSAAMSEESGASLVPEGTRRGKEVVWKSKSLDEAVGPVAGDGIVELCGAGQADFDGGDAAEEEVQVIGDGQKLIGHFQQTRAALEIIEEMIKRIDGHELNAGFGKDEFATGGFLDGGVGAIGAGVAVMVGQREERLSGAGESVVESPGIDAQALGLNSGSSDFAQAGFQLIENGDDVPAQGAGDLHPAIGETMNFLEGDFAGIETSEDDAAAFGAKIAGDVMKGAHRPRARWR